MSEQKLSDEQWILFLGYIRGYFEEKKGNQEKKDDLMSEIMRRFFEKQMIDVNENVLEKMTKITELNLPEQLQSIITELMHEGFESTTKLNEGDDK